VGTQVYLGESSPIVDGTARANAPREPRKPVCPTAILAIDHDAVKSAFALKPSVNLIRGKWRGA
jgi:hypothetical protein